MPLLYHSVNAVIPEIMVLPTSKALRAACVCMISLIDIQTDPLPVYFACLLDRGEENCTECSAKAVETFGASRSDGGLGVKPLASRLQAAPARGRG